MIKHSLIISTLAAVTILSSTPNFAADQDLIYGSQLMTSEERFEYRKKNMNAKTEAERAQLREQHQAMIQQRAKERNMKLPDAAPASGAGMGTGGGMKSGGGMGGGNR